MSGHGVEYYRGSDLRGKTNTTVKCLDYFSKTYIRMKASIKPTVF